MHNQNTCIPTAQPRQCLFQHPSLPLARASRWRGGPCRSEQSSSLSCQLRLQRKERLSCGDAGEIKRGDVLGKKVLHNTQIKGYKRRKGNRQTMANQLGTGQPSLRGNQLLYTTNTLPLYTHCCPTNVGQTSWTHSTCDQYYQTPHTSEKPCLIPHRGHR